MGLAAPYRQRRPERTAFYQCWEDYWEEFKESYAYFYEKDYGPWRAVVEKTVRALPGLWDLSPGFCPGALSRLPE